MKKLYPEPKWAERGKLRWAWWDWEPLDHYKRIGNAKISVGPGSALWGKNWYERIHSEDTVKMMADLGVNVAVTHFHKGMGLKFERPDIEKTKKLVHLCHKHGIKVLGYTQLGSIFYETFLDEEPTAREWTARDREGKPQLWSYWRWRPCINNKEFINYVKKCIRVGIKEVNLDGFHFDNCFGKACYCERCLALFRSYLKKNFLQPRERFGIDNFRHVELPPHKDKPTTIEDPIYQEWLRFCSQNFANTLAGLNQFIKGLNPACVMITNYTSWSQCSGWVNGNAEWLPLIFPTHDFIFAENYFLPGVENGKLYSQSKVLKVAQAGGIQVFSTSNMRNYESLNPKRIKLDLAEVAAFGSVPGTTWALRPTGKDGGRGFAVDNPDFKIHLKGYLDFFRNHQSFYQDVEPANSIVLFWSEDSFAFDPVAAYNSVEEIQDTLIKLHIPYKIVFEQDLSLKEEGVSLIIPELRCLSDGICKKLCKSTFDLTVIMGEAGLYNENFRQRVASALTPLYNRKETIHLVGRCREKDKKEVFQLLRERAEIKISAPENVVTEVTENKEGKLVHLINYNNKPVEREIVLTLSENNSNFGFLFSPDQIKREVKLPIKEGKLVIPELDTYSVIVLPRKDGKV